MSLMDLKQASRVECVDYRAESGSKRCEWFGKDKACGKAGRSEGVCEEWARANPSHASHTGLTVSASLGNAGRTATASREPPQPQQGLGGGTPPSVAPEEPEGAQWPTEADVEAFSKMGVELRIGSPTLSEDLWLVPSYTEADRLEMTAADAIAVCRIVRAFPGSKVADVIRSTKTPQTATTQEATC